MIIELSGRIDSLNASEVEKEITDRIGSADEAVTFDVKNLTYISSAGLRVLMKVRKLTGRSIEILDVSRDVYDIFETTGFMQHIICLRRMTRTTPVRFWG